MQPSNSMWHDMRNGRLTSSNFYSTHTKDNSINNKPAVVTHIMGYTKVNPNIKSLKYGREIEPVANSVYLKEFFAAHKNVKSDECGIFLDSVYTYIAASPDLLIFCSCCGDGCVEIRCPLITKCNTCSSFCTCKISIYLIDKSEKLSLKINHSYFAQVQGQMYVTGRKWYDFFVYTLKVLLQREYGTMIPIFQIFLKAFSTFSFLLYCQS